MTGSINFECFGGVQDIWPPPRTSQRRERRIGAAATGVSQEDQFNESEHCWRCPNHLAPS